MKMLNANMAMIFLNVLMIIYSLWILSHKPKKSPIHLFWILFGLTVWLIGLHLAISYKILFPEDITGIQFYLIVLLGVAVTGLILLGGRPLRDFFLGLSQQQLLMLQGVRIFFGAGFLIQAATGDLPVGFGIIDGLTHISAGFFGLIAAYSVVSNLDASRRLWFANLFGLADILIVATSLAFILLPVIGVYHPMMYAVFLPAPLWLWFHLLSIRQLVNQSKLNLQSSN